MFSEHLLDDATALARIDSRLRELASSGARVRRDLHEASGAIESLTAGGPMRPRAMLVTGPHSRFVRALLQPTCPVPLVAWHGEVLPGWVGGLDLVVVLAPAGTEESGARAVAEAGRRGSEVIIVSPPDSPVAAHTASRATTLVPVVSNDPFAAVAVAADLLHQLGLGPQSDAAATADELDEVATQCSPFVDQVTNPAKAVAVSLGDTGLLLWGTSPMAARAARRVAEWTRHATGRPALAADAEHLSPVLSSARPRDIFADPFDGDGGEAPRPGLLVLDDGASGAVPQAERGLEDLAERQGVRVHAIEALSGDALARHARLLLTGAYAAHYLGLGLLDPDA